MSIINNILELAVKRNINSIDPSNFGDVGINAAVAKANQALAVTSSLSEDRTTTFYGGYTLPAPGSLMKNPTGTITVGSSPFNNAAGYCCQWTVPAGVSTVQFQMWGAGGNGSGCSWGACCAYSLSGGSGEYTYGVMSVTPGQVYTLCAGGGPAVSNNACYSYCACDGCSSFICGSNSTCILSCGGLTGYANMCGSGMREYYPSAGNNYASTQTNIYACTGYFQCSQYFSTPIFKYDGTQVGGVTSGNKISSQAKIPSLVWGTAQCGNSICYMCQYTYHVSPTHTVCRLSPGWNGYDYSGCCASSNWGVRMAGLGGLGVIASCYQGPEWGQCGNSGQIILSYK